MKRSFFSILLIILWWNIADFITHGIILMHSYEATAQLWRPYAQMHNVLLLLVKIVVATGFVVLYKQYILNKSLKNGVIFGTIIGAMFGFSSGYVSYAVMPITHFIAFTWFASIFVQKVVAGLIVGALVKK